MSDNNTSKLSEQQIELCKAFRRVASRAAILVIEQAKNRDMLSDHSSGQYNSLLAEEMILAEPILEDNYFDFVSAFKVSSQVLTDKLLDPEDSQVEVPDGFEDTLQNNILFHLLIRASNLEILPRNIMELGCAEAGIPENFSFKF